MEDVGRFDPKGILPRKDGNHVQDGHYAYTAGVYGSLAWRLIDPKTEKIFHDQAKGCKAAQDRQKSYVDRKRKPMEFEVGDRVMLKDKTTVLQPHSSEVGFINHMVILKLLKLIIQRQYSDSNLPHHQRASKAQVDQGSQIKMIQVKEMMQDNDLKNSKSKDKGSKSRSQSMDEQSHYKQDKTITRQSINVKRHIFNVIGGTEEFEERDLNIGGDC
ncbi:hypothetical protein Tco_1370763 [Tanacetum coccineum]